LWITRVAAVIAARIARFPPKTTAFRVLQRVPRPPAIPGHLRFPLAASPAPDSTMRSLPGALAPRLHVAAILRDPGTLASHLPSSARGDGDIHPTRSTQHRERPRHNPRRLAFLARPQGRAPARPLLTNSFETAGRLARSRRSRSPTINRSRVAAQAARTNDRTPTLASHYPATHTLCGTAPASPSLSTPRPRCGPYARPRSLMAVAGRSSVGAGGNPIPPACACLSPASHSRETQGFFLGVRFWRAVFACLSRRCGFWLLLGPAGDAGTCGPLALGGI
jgi:hypothetical protein